MQPQIPQTPTVPPNNPQDPQTYTQTELLYPHDQCIAPASGQEGKVSQNVHPTVLQAPNVIDI